jgi:hypothetical protein
MQSDTPAFFQGYVPDRQMMTIASSAVTIRKIGRNTAPTGLDIFPASSPKLK